MTNKLSEQIQEVFLDQTQTQKKQINHLVKLRRWSEVVHASDDDDLPEDEVHDGVELGLEIDRFDQRLRVPRVRILETGIRFDQVHWHEDNFARKAKMLLPEKK